MVEKFGISMDAGLEERLEDGITDEQSRSERIRALVQLGLEVEAAADMIGRDVPDDPMARRAFVRQAFLDSRIQPEEGEREPGVATSRS